MKEVDLYAMEQLFDEMFWPTGEARFEQLASPFWVSYYWHRPTFKPRQLF